ncbi:hypothetical protein F5Y00DRAFT_227154 [Daldinia vernicosa]|uniref:uncharacterized protein n=1 Tax=Daldinia vernicosa TaxID=114800 RepID=UPI002007E1AC|nr:uncharacterized protein F5Y00DRAFT_227154 [Daldinia vernicosa]KAI0852615.1 hypothetical protein F5Y00DRAFT_227154 [Daldinia vernicosa]
MKCINLLILFKDQNTPGMPLGPQSQGMPHQYHIGQAPMSALAPTPGSGPMPAASRPLNSRPPTVERRPGLANSSSGSGADSAASGPERDSAHRVTKRQGRKKQTRANKDGEGDLSISDSSNLQWRPGMRQIKILDSWSEERKEATRIRNELISRCKADHIRDQNRVSARKSRQKKEDALQTARSNVQKLQEQNAALAQQVQELATRVNIQQDEIDSRGQTIAMFASENAALQERINLLEMQILEGGQGTQGFPAEQIPGQNLAQVLPPYSGQVQSQLQGSMFMQDSAQNFTQRRSNTPIQAQGEAASEQAQATPSSQRGLEIQEAPRGGELDQGQEGEGADTNPATSDLSPVNTSQCQARPGGQVNGEIADAGDMPIFDFQVLDDFLDDAGQA